MIKKDKLSFGKNYEFNTKIFYKLILITGSILYLSFGIFFKYFNDYNDPMAFSGRLIGGGLLFIVFLLSFFNEFVENHLREITHGLTYILIGHLAYLTYLNNFQYNFSISLIIVITFINLIFESTSSDLVFNILLSIFIVITLVQVEAVQFSKLMYLFIYFLMSSITYITSYQKRISQRDMKQINNRLEVAVNSAKLGIWQWNLKTNEVIYDQNWLGLFDYKTDDLNNTIEDFNKIMYEDDQQKFKKQFTKLINGEQKFYQNEYRIRNKFNQIKWVRRSAKAINDEITGEVVKILGSDLDITEQKENEREIEKLLYIDELTGLYNRRYLNIEINKFKFSRQYPISVIVGDLDSLKYINDQYGHAEGDQYLEVAGELLINVLRTEDIAARLGGDEFGILLPNTTSEIVKKICDRIINEFKQFNQQGILPEHITISLGTATVKSKNENLEKAFIKADKDMYKNKRKKD